MDPLVSSTLPSASGGWFSWRVSAGGCLVSFGMTRGMKDHFLLSNRLLLTHHSPYCHLEAGGNESCSLHPILAKSRPSSTSLQRSLQTFQNSRPPFTHLGGLLHPPAAFPLGLLLDFPPLKITCNGLPRYHYLLSGFSLVLSFAKTRLYLLLPVSNMWPIFSLQRQSDFVCLPKRHTCAPHGWR